MKNFRLYKIAHTKTIRFMEKIELDRSFKTYTTLSRTLRNSNNPNKSISTTGKCHPEFLGNSLVSAFMVEGALGRGPGCWALKTRAGGGGGKYSPALHGLSRD